MTDCFCVRCCNTEKKSTKKAPKRKVEQTMGEKRKLLYNGIDSGIFVKHEKLHKSELYLSHGMQVN